MADRTPTESTNLDIYGDDPLPWSRSHDLLAAGPSQAKLTSFLSTTRPDGRPHVAGVGVRWHDGDLYFSSGAGTRKSKNLAADSACVIAIGLDGIDLVLEGEASRVDDPQLLETVAAKFREGVGRWSSQGWPLQRAIQRPKRGPAAVGPLSVHDLHRVRRGYR